MLALLRGAFRWKRPSRQPASQPERRRPRKRISCATAAQRIADGSSQYRRRLAPRSRCSRRSGPPTAGQHAEQGCRNRARTPPRQRRNSRTARLRETRNHRWPSAHGDPPAVVGCTERTGAGFRGRHDQLKRRETTGAILKQDRDFLSKQSGATPKEQSGIQQRRHECAQLPQGREHHPALRRPLGARLPQEVVACLRNDLDNLLICFGYKTLAERKQAGTTNAIEPEFCKIRRRTRPVETFQDQASMDRVLYAVSIHEDKSEGIGTPSPRYIILYVIRSRRGCNSCW